MKFVADCTEPCYTERKGQRQKFMAQGREKIHRQSNRMHLHCIKLLVHLVNKKADTIIE